MNSTNSVNETWNDPWGPYWDAMTVITIQSGWVTLPVSFVQLFLLIYIVWREYLGANAAVSCTNASTAGAPTTGAETSASRRLCFLPLNLLIFALIAFNCTGSFTGLIINGGLPASDICNICDNATPYFVLSDLCIACYQFLTVYYTWIRNFPVAETTARWSLPYLRALVVLYGLLQVSQFSLWLPQVQMSFALDSAAIAGVTTASDVVVFLFDAAILVSFVAYLRRSRKSGEGLSSVQDRMAVVARFGVASFVVYQIYLCSYIVFSAIFAPVEPGVSVGVFSVVYGVQQYVPLVYIFLQLGMKWLVHVARERGRSVMTGDSTNRGFGSGK
ncbi:hypothetical protein BC830DRAFT_1078759 [Chytriomyces sp. MP71]|nr:hypothetical protein BC830DRAFT_1078759 [Chytriomyces sp. MP71]